MILCVVVYPFAGLLDERPYLISTKHLLTQLYDVIRWRTPLPKQLHNSNAGTIDTPFTIGCCRCEQDSAFQDIEDGTVDVIRVDKLDIRSFGLLVDKCLGVWEDCGARHVLPSLKLCAMDVVEIDPTVLPQHHRLCTPDR